MMNVRSFSVEHARRVASLFAATLLAIPLHAGQWKQSPTPAAPVRVIATGAVEENATVTNASRPGVVAIQGTGVVSMVGDDDGFGFGTGWVPPLTCEVFDNRGAADLGVFDQREPTPGKYDSICTFVGSWDQMFTAPAGGVGQFTVRMRILGASGDASQCFNAPCGCTTPTPQLLINNVDQPGFFSDPGCAQITYWTKTFQGTEAQIASDGHLHFEVHWNNQPFAIDWSQVMDVLPTAAIKLLDGDGQKGVVKNATEKKLRVQLTSNDPSVSIAGMAVTFAVTSSPPKATGAAVGADEKATSTSYSAIADANGIASTTLVFGDTEGTYTVQASTALGQTKVSFSETGQKPDSVAILKDSTAFADKADSYATAADKPTPFYAVGVKNGQKLGPIKVNWSLASSGSGATRGDGGVSPTSDQSSTSFTPSHVGQIALSAKPSNLKGVSAGKADLYVTSLYVDIDNSFSSSSPVDQKDKFVPGVTADGNDIPLTTMAGSGQTVKLHVVTGPGAKGQVAFSVNGSSFPGVAMNYPVDNPDTGPDVTFGSGTSTTVPFAGDGDTFATLNVRDYGAIGTITVTVTAGKNTYTLTPLRMPVDNGFGLPKAGWPTTSAHVDTTDLHDSDDIDDQPAGQTGDGLSNYEEYRGFVAAKTHIRTDPRKRDIFVVADPQFLVGTITTVTLTTTLPFPVRYLDLSEVAGEDYAARGILKGKPVVDPNRTGVPGATSGGQRAVRLVKQEQYPAAVVVEVAPGVTENAAVWQVGIFGATILDSTNPDVIDQAAAGGPATFAAQSPDTTRWSEVYEQTFRNVGIATNFTQLLYLDTNGQPVPPCPSVGTIPGCDEYDYTHHLVLPRIYPGGLFQLYSVPYNDGDWYSKRTGTCADMTSILDYGVTDAEMQASRAIVGAHELGHSLHIDHTLICGDLMFGVNIPPLPSVGLMDIEPLPVFFSSDEISQIQLRP
jgi:hypothetical protein